MDQNLPEGLTLEYKETYSREIVKSVAAMANTYGGIILVGVKDQPDSDRLVGVDGSISLQIVNACHDRLEPPWEPEIISVPLEADKKILVIRIDPSRAPRPLVLDDRVPIRLRGRNAYADRTRLFQMFSDETSPSNFRLFQHISQSTLPIRPDGEPPVDFVLRSGLMIPLGEKAAYRPLSELSIESLASALNNSQLNQTLIKWSGKFSTQGLNLFHRVGFNRARHVQLSWQALVGNDPTFTPVESQVGIKLSNVGITDGYMEVSLSVLTSVSQMLREGGWPSNFYRNWLIISELRYLIDGVLGALVDDEVVRVLSDIADVDRSIIRQPATLDFLTASAVADLLFLDGLQVIENSGPSHGANLVSDPTIDLHSPEERRDQLNRWLMEIVLDAGLVGIEGVIAGLSET